jgi:hypothetical protein
MGRLYICDLGAGNEAGAPPPSPLPLAAAPGGGSVGRRDKCGRPLQSTLAAGVVRTETVVSLGGWRWCCGCGAPVDGALPSCGKWGRGGQRRANPLPTLCARSIDSSTSPNHLLDFLALIRYLNSPPNSTMQKEDSSSHQNVGTYMEY